MPRFLADHNFNERLLGGLRRMGLELDVVRLRELGMIQASDHDVLIYAAEADLVVLTHDIQTLVPFADERVRRGEPMAGVVFVPSLLSLGRALDHLSVLIGCADASDWTNRTYRIPL